MDQKSNQTQLDRKTDEEEGKDESEAVELILFQVSECYVYLIPPRKSAASYRYFVLRVEENIGGRLRHAFIGIGFRERPEAYDFQAALYDHMKYLNKKKTAEEMEEHYQKTSSVDYSLKEGETLVLQIRNNGSRGVKSSFFAQCLNNLPLDEKGKTKEGTICLKPPPPPPGPLSPISPVKKSPFSSPTSTSGLQSSTSDGASHSTVESLSDDSQPSATETSYQEIVEDDFGDFQAAG